MSEHAQLTFENKSKMMTEPQIILRLDEAIKIVLQWSEEEKDIYQFIIACNLAVNAVKNVNVPILIRYIIARLTGKALENVKYKDLTKGVYIQKYLDEAFEFQY